MAALPALPAALAAVQGGSALLEGFGQYKQFRSAAEEAEYRARIADANAAAVAQQTSGAVRRVEREAGQVLGAQRAAIAQSGFGASGTMLGVARESGTAAALDAMNTRYEGSLREQSLRSEAEMSRWSAEQNRSASRMALGSAAILAPAKAYLGFSMAGGKLSAPGSAVARHSVIPGLNSYGNSVRSTLGRI